MLLEDLAEAGEVEVLVVLQQDQRQVVLAEGQPQVRHLHGRLLAALQQQLLALAVALGLRVLLDGRQLALQSRVLPRRLSQFFCPISKSNSQAIHSNFQLYLSNRRYDKNM